jgi:mannose-6-phosphate isomerase
MLYPLKFEKIFKEKIWGGRKLESAFGMILPNENKFGESWEVACHKNGISIISEGILKGRSLEEILIEYKEKLVGEKIYSEFGNKFPLLIKYLDINDSLSVQVHPSNNYKLLEEGELGKSEVWYILEASEDAKLILGIKEGISKEEFEKKSKDKDFDNLFNIVSVKKGDFINVEPGLAHTSSSGSVLICEIQQNSDTTYRIYDFDRLVNGKPRELHLEKAIDVLDFEKKPNILREGEAFKNEVEGASIEKLTKNEYFAVEKICVDGKYEEKVEGSFKIFSIIEGEGELEWDRNLYKIKKGDTYLIPASLDFIIIKGKVDLLKSYV